MTKLFLTKVWGFDPESYPALGFNTEGGRNKYLREASPGDWIILAGTKSAPTAAEMQGRLLGRIRVGTEQIDVESVLRSINYPIPHDHFNDDGVYRWPFSLPMLEAYRFTGYPDLRDVLGSYLSGQEWAAFAINLEDRLGTGAIEAINALATEKADIAEAEEIIRQRARGQALLANRQSTLTGPGPSTTREGWERETTHAAAYILRLNGPQEKYSSKQKEVYKVGYSGDPEKRVVELNRGLVSGVTGYAWEIALTQKFDDETQAYQFEQLVHSALTNRLVDGEREIYEIPFSDLQSTWITIFQKADWALI